MHDATQAELGLEVALLFRPAPLNTVLPTRGEAVRAAISLQAAFTPTHLPPTFKNRCKGVSLATLTLDMIAIFPRDLRTYQDVD